MVRIAALELVDDCGIDHGDSLLGEWLQVRCQTPLAAGEPGPDQGGEADADPSPSLGTADESRRLLG